MSDSSNTPDTESFLFHIISFLSLFMFLVFSTPLQRPSVVIVVFDDQSRISIKNLFLFIYVSNDLSAFEVEYYCLVSQQSFLVLMNIITKGKKSHHFSFVKGYYSSKNRRDNSIYKLTIWPRLPLYMSND